MLRLAGAGNMATTWKGKLPGPGPSTQEPTQEQLHSSYLPAAVRVILAAPSALAAPLGGSAAAAR